MMQSVLLQKITNRENVRTRLSRLMSRNNLNKKNAPKIRITFRPTVFV